jgi:hypothetical protein
MENPASFLPSKKGEETGGVLLRPQAFQKVALPEKGDL